jgi:hypothetical protein
MCGGSPKAPKAPPAVPEAPRAPDIESSETAGAKDKRRRRQAGGQADSRSTILTSSRGVQGGTATATKTLLGS